MVEQYKIAATLDIFHTYYESGVCQGLVICPDDRTEELLRRFGFVFHRSTQGFVLLSSSKDIKASASYISNVTGCGMFQFEVSSTNSYFNLFTDLPLDQLGYNCYNSADRSKPSDDSITTLYPTFHAEPSANYAMKIQLELKDLGQFDSRYRIQLNARKSRWEYIIIDKSNSEYNDLKIKSREPRDIAFSNRGPIVLKNGQSATLFSSESQYLTITNYTKYKLDLVDVKANEDKTKYVTLFSGLPVPRPENLSIDPGSRSISSLMYVYV